MDFLRPFNRESPDSSRSASILFLFRASDKAWPSCRSRLGRRQLARAGLIGPQTFFQRLGDASVFHVWKDRAPIVSDLGVSYAAAHDFDTCPTDLDILFVPGGLKGTVPAMGNPAVTGFLADRGARARFVTSVCTGSLLLGAAGLLEGYRASSYWMVRDLLPLFGASRAAA